MLGRNGGRPGFTYDNLTNDALTHTPTVGGYVTDRSTGEQVWRDNPLNRQPYHQKTNLKMPGRRSVLPAIRVRATSGPLSRSRGSRCP
ncbi:hypothetical protein ACLG6S_02005 [Thermodesulfobacteriota bacterium B35]